MPGKQVGAEEVYGAYTDAQEAFEEARESLDELQLELEEEFSGFTTALDEIRAQLAECRWQLRQFSRRANMCLYGSPSSNVQQEDWGVVLPDSNAEDPYAAPGL